MCSYLLCTWHIASTQEILIQPGVFHSLGCEHCGAFQVIVSLIASRKHASHSNSLGLIQGCCHSDRVGGSRWGSSGPREFMICLWGMFDPWTSFLWFESGCVHLMGPSSDGGELGPSEGHFPFRSSGLCFPWVAKLHRGWSAKSPPLSSDWMWVLVDGGGEVVDTWWKAPSIWKSSLPHNLLWGQPPLRPFISTRSGGFVGFGSRPRPNVKKLWTDRPLWSSWAGGGCCVWLGGGLQMLDASFTFMDFSHSPCEKLTG